MQSAPYFGPKVLNYDIKLPERIPLIGQYCILEPLKQHHLPSLFQSIKQPKLWDFVAPPPPTSPQSLRELFFVTNKQYFYYAIKKIGEDRVVGCVAYMYPLPNFQSVEVGYFRYALDVQRTTLTTEVFYLLAKYAFEDMKYYRLQWKCNKLNVASKKAAERFGFAYEGCWRQEMIEKGYYRDSLYYSMLGKEWEVMKQELEEWLDKGNFDENGKEKRKLKLREVREKLEKERTDEGEKRQQGKSE